ncbi:hypothetical protein JL722_11144 [Aureococcus anophagefferens]|nr:hypothetical protein JL722_11144 [Aureococcus anophagefferens]
MSCRLWLNVAALLVVAEAYVVAPRRAVRRCTHLRANAPDAAPARVGRLRRLYRWLRPSAAGAPPLSGDEVVGLVVLGMPRVDAEALPPAEARRLLADAGWRAAGAEAAEPAERRPPDSKTTHGNPFSGRNGFAEIGVCMCEHDGGDAAAPADPAPAAAAPAREPATRRARGARAARRAPGRVARRGRGDAGGRARGARGRGARARAPGARVARGAPAAELWGASDAELWELAKAEARAVAGADAAGDAAADVDGALSRSWPDLVAFTDLLTRESLLRLRVLGPAFAEPLKAEVKLRRDAYRGWLGLVDGEGFLPPPPSDLDFGASLLDPTGGLPAEATDEAKAAFARLKEDQRDAAGRATLARWERALGPSPTVRR